MSFTSVKFLGFLSVSFFAYFLTPKKMRWASLLLFSLAYYYLSSSTLIVVLLLDTVVAYLTALLISKNTSSLLKTDDPDKKKEAKAKVKKINRTILRIGIVLILGMLILIKYEGFIAENLNGISSVINIPVMSFVLPVGISFYTLQAISYVVDVYRNKHEAEKNFLHFLLYMSYFPQILQGPIPRFGRLSAQLIEGHEFDYERFCFGLQLVAWGLIKKAVLADRLSSMVVEVFADSAKYSGMVALLAAFAYGLQIYGDFSGGIDVIRGISEVFGITLDENFRQPFFARSVEEFWRRWHISLGSWMKDYVFYPLSLSKTFGKLSKKARKTFGDSFGKKVPSIIAMFIVYFLVGIWHGANWKYVAYGIWNGIFISSRIFLEPYYDKGLRFVHINPDSKIWKGIQIVRTYVICSTGRIISRSENISEAWRMLCSIMKNSKGTLSWAESVESFGLDWKNWLVLLVVTLIIFAVDYFKEKGIDVRREIAKKPLALRWAIYYAMIMMILIFGYYGPGYDASTFIYGKF